MYKSSVHPHWILIGSARPLLWKYPMWNQHQHCLHLAQIAFILTTVLPGMSWATNVGAIGLGLRVYPVCTECR